jgi:hypothetical protein
MDYTGVDKAGGGFNPFAAGDKQYGSGRSNPTMGPVDKTGYKERDLASTVFPNPAQQKAQAGARKNAIMAYLKAGQEGRFFTPAFLRGGNDGAI